MCDSDGDKNRCLTRRERRIRLRKTSSHVASGPPGHLVERPGSLTSVRQAAK